MGILVDIIIISFIILSTILAYKKGLIAQAIKLCAMLVAVVITLLVYRPVANFIIDTTNIDETLQNGIYERSYELMVNKEQDPEKSNSIIEQATNGTLQHSSRELAIQIINIAVIIILFFGIKITLRFISSFANAVSKLPIINKLNKVGGIIYGLIRGIIIVYACLLLIGFIGKIDKANFLHKSINESNIGKVMYQNNILNGLL